MLILKGHVTTGVQHFRGRMTNHREVFQKAAGRELYPGTLNVKVDHEIPIREDFRIAGKEIGEPDQDLLFEHCLINGIEAYRIRPYHLPTGLGGHGDDTLEITCSEWVSGVEEGAEVEISLFRD
jgi:CTP-dependent riboflavin kinase